MPYCCGKGARYLEKMIVSDMDIEGHAAAAAKYSGVHMTPRCPAQIETGHRIMAGKATWASMGNFWT
eukprot:9474245-Pyramimonas_sp.AAC.1